MVGWDGLEEQMGRTFGYHRQMDIHNVQVAKLTAMVRDSSDGTGEIEMSLRESLNQSLIWDLSVNPSRSIQQCSI